MRKCSKCKEVKDEKEFHGKTSPYCKPCRKKYRQQKSRREVARKHHLKNSYGMTENDIQMLLDYQGGKCPICLQDLVKPFVDHNYENGLVRGLLCNKCNSGIGLLNDDPDNLIRAAAYLGFSSKLTNFKVNPKRTSRHRRSLTSEGSECMISESTTERR